VLLLKIEETSCRVLTCSDKDNLQSDNCLRHYQTDFPLNSCRNWIKDLMSQVRFFTYL